MKKPPPPPPLKKKTFFSGGGLRAYSVPQAGAPVFNIINKHSGEYAAIPLNIVPSNTISITFVYKISIFAKFFDKIAAKYTPKRTKLHHFLKFSPGSMPPNPPNKRVALPRPTWRFAPCIYPHFRKLDWTLPPKWNPKYAHAEMHLKCSREHHC